MSLETDYQIGTPIKFPNGQLIPISKTSRLVSYRYTWGLIWGRPDSVLVQFLDGSEGLLPVRDITREALIGVLALSLITHLMIRFFGKILRG